MPDDYQDEVLVLKQIARDYIISSPALAAQQKGQEKILELLFGVFCEEISEGMKGKTEKVRALPHRFRHLIDADFGSPARIAADAVASLTDAAAVRLYQRLTGTSSGSVLDPIVR